MDIDAYRIISAFILSLIAGLSTGLGGCISLFIKKLSMKFLAITLGFSAGIMLYISMVEILDEARSLLNISFGPKTGLLYTLMSFFGGMIVIILINKLIPNDIKINNIVYHDNLKMKNKMFRLGIFTAIVIAIHNFPEGIATFVSSFHSLTHAVPIVLAIALHNLPEGILVSVPIYYATNDKRKALMYSFMSGMIEPLGALIGFLILLPVINNVVFGLLYGFVAGIMVFISLDELFPTAIEYGGNSLAITGLVSGMGFMALSLWLFI